MLNGTKACVVLRGENTLLDFNDLMDYLKNQLKEVQKKTVIKASQPKGGHLTLMVA